MFPASSSSFRHLAGRALVLCLAFASGMSAPRAAEPESPVARHNNILLAVRVNRIQRLERDASRFLEAVSGRPLAENPVGDLLSSILRNPSFEGLRRDAFLETTWLAERGTGGPASVHAFPAADAPSYVQYILSRDGVRHQNVHGVYAIQEAGAGGGEIFLTTVHERLILYSLNRRALEMAREVYRALPEGLLSADRADVSLHLHCKRFSAVHAESIDRGYALLIANVTADLTQSGFLDPGATGRVLTRAVASWREGLDQMRVLVVRAHLADNAITLNGHVRWDDGAIRALARVAAPARPSLLAFAPDDAVSVQWSALPGAAPELALQNLLYIATAGLDSAPGQDVRNILESCGRALLAVEPLESLHAALPSGDLPGGALAVWRVGKPEALPAGIAALASLAAPDNSVRQILEQRALLLDIEPGHFAIGAVPATSITVTLRKAVADDPVMGKSEEIVFSRRYALATRGAFLFLASGDDAEDRLRAAFARVGSPATQAPGFVTAGFAALPPSAWVHLARPGALIASTARAALHPSRGDLRRDALDLRRELAPFVRFRDTSPPLACSFAGSGTETFSFAAHIPLAPLQDLYNLCLRTIPLGFTEAENEPQP